MKKNYKLFLTIASLVIYQSLLYLISKLTPIKTTILTSTIDSLIPFIPYFIYFYIFWYVMLFIVPYFFSVRQYCENGRDRISWFHSA